MAYTINLTDGTVFAVINDGTINTSSSMTLVGKNYAGYGEFLDENFIHLLENSSDTTAPSNPLTGQLWWDKTNGLLKVYNGSTFKTVSSTTASATQPASNVTGDLWYDTVNQQLKIYTGAAFIVVGPAFSATQGISGAIPETIADSVGSTKFITGLYVNNVRVGVVYDSSAFVPQASLQSAFPTIYPGVTLSATVSGARYEGTANNANFLNSVASSQFMRSDQDTSTTGVLRVLNNSGMRVGSTNAFSVTQSSNDAQIRGDISSANLVIQANVAGTIYNVASALGSNGTFAVANAATVGTTLGVVGNATGGNLNTSGQVSATGNITGGNVTAALITATGAGTAFSAAGNVQVGNVRTTGQVSATGSIISAGNVSGAFVLGNGSQLTGLSAAVSVNKMSNGTTEANIGTPGGNANVTVGGTSNVAVFTTTGVVVTGITTPSITKSGSNAVGNIGSDTNYFNRVFATSTSALYADVAERFAADERLDAGTVVELGGVAEITRSQRELSEDVFGVVSTAAAYLMNAGAGNNDTHPAVAMAGRVPVKVRGTVRKGDRLVSAGGGIARAACKGEATPFNVIGRALEDKFTEEDGTVEAIVTVK
jgi:hypothetical protein